MKNVPRIYVQDQLYEGADLSLSVASVHHMTHVLRMSCGDVFTMFNGVCGEYAATLRKRHIRTEKYTEKYTERYEAGIGARIKAPYVMPFLELVFAPLKPQAMHFLAEKATELGVTHLTPVVCDHSHIRALSLDKMTAWTIAATQQSERLTPPIVSNVQTLESWMRHADTPTACALERFTEQNNTQQAWYSLLVGPEGGFSEKERTCLMAHPCIIPISLGPYVLRSETAALCGLSRWIG